MKWQYDTFEEWAAAHPQEAAQLLAAQQQNPTPPPIFQTPTRPNSVNPNFPANPAFDTLNTRPTSSAPVGGVTPGGSSGTPTLASTNPAPAASVAPGAAAAAGKGMGLGQWLPYVIGAGASIWGAQIASSAAKNAAKTQADYGKQALDLQREMYQTTRSDLAPYRQGGAAAFGALSGLMGLGGGGGEMPGTVPLSGVAGVQPQTPQMPVGAPPEQALTDAASLQGTPTMRTASSYGGAPGAKVKMRAPTGEIADVPAAQVSAFQQKGATVIGRA